MPRPRPYTAQAFAAFKPPLPANGKAPCGWADIEVGSLVLATEGPGEGWWESVVLGAEAELFTLKWRNCPDLSRFVRRRWQLALLHPAGRKSSLRSCLSTIPDSGT